ncbi:hypothetical protein [Nocardia uniformis]|nr:hypothetical protein [Nocardia uniformis]
MTVGLAVCGYLCAGLLVAALAATAFIAPARDRAAEDVLTR